MLSDVTATYTGTMNALYARNSGITIGEGSVTMPSSYDKMAKASTNGRIVLIDVNQIDSSGTSSDCESASDCDVSSSSSGAIYFGGLATVKVYKLLPSGKSYKEGHTVQATAVDAGSPLFMVGTHKTDVNGQASVWVLTANDAGDTYRQLATLSVFLLVKRFFFGLSVFLVVFGRLPKMVDFWGGSIFG